MAKIVYGTPAGYGSTMVKEFIAATIKLKADGKRIAALLKETTADSAATANINVASIPYGEIFSVSGTDNGGNFYNLLVQESIGIITILDTISDDKLADLDMG